ncbi:hypothetical protein RHGRI_015888 [Rhododendron griersonianum]|nr:hypothetical protein RHGRI_015877 [Rhododendron griersonianum]KAG5542944.1 hypothetical protein RHGRI_015888 [Rhododendron griersonianum]
MKEADCSQLKEKILSRIQSWINNTLTYGGRQQLIQSGTKADGFPSNLCYTYSHT